MLNRKDKAEFIKDGLSLKRKVAFAKTKNFSVSLSLDAYIRFLMDAQKALPFSISRKKTITYRNKL